MRKEPREQRQRSALADGGPSPHPARRHPTAGSRGTGHVLPTKHNSHSIVTAVDHLRIQREVLPDSRNPGSDWRSISNGRI